MEWLVPGFIYGCLFAAIPAVLHVFRGRIGRPFPLPSIIFLKTSRYSDISNKIRRWIVLFLRVAACVLMAFAFARPYLKTNYTGARATVIVIDNSMSLRARGRWQAMQEWIGKQIGPPQSDAMLGVITMNPSPAWVLPLTRDCAEAREIISKIQPSWAQTRAEPALRLASDIMAASSARERKVVFATDHQSKGWVGTDFQRKLPPDVSVVFPSIQNDLPRQGWFFSSHIVRLPEGKLMASVSIGADSDQRRVLTVFAENTNDSDIVTKVDLEAGKQKRVDIDITPLASSHCRWVRITLDPDDLPDDDVTYALTPIESSSTRSLYLDSAVPNGDFDFVTAALNSVAGVPPVFIVQATAETAWPTQAVALLRNPQSFVGGNGDRLDAFLNGGGHALVLLNRTIASSEEWWNRLGLKFRDIAQAGEDLSLTEWVPDHAIVVPLAQRGLRGLVGWRFRQGWALPTALAAPIAYWNDGSIAIGEIRVGDGRLIVCGFSSQRSDGDWATEAAFPPFLHRTVNYLFDCNLNKPPTPAHWIGESIALPGDGQWRPCSGPAAKGQAIRVSGSVIADTPGVFAFDQNGETSLWAINTSPDESDLTPWAPGEPWKDLEHILVK